MYKLIDLKNKFQSFWDAHSMVLHQFYGAIEEYIVIPDKNYFSVNTEFTGSSVSGKSITHSFRVSIADKMSLDYPETEHEAVSNCIEIAQDFLAFMNKEDITYSGANMQPFREDMGDICAGVVLAVNIILPMGLNECAIPN